MSHGKGRHVVYGSASFWEDYNKLSKEEQRRVDKIKEQISSNPYTGKSLGHNFFREKRFDGKRLYYLVYDDYVIVLVVAISGKKTQQSTINAIKSAFEVYRKEVYDKFVNK